VPMSWKRPRCRRSSGRLRNGHHPRVPVVRCRR
jgi:hypothetical protein